MSNTKKLKSEASQEPITFEFEDVTYEIPAPKRWPLDVIQAEEDGKILAFLKALLGMEQYNKFVKKGRTIEDLDNFFNALQDAADVDMEKS